MPDADDFDIEYFRNLLKGSSPKGGAAPPAEPPLPAAKKKTRSTPNPTVAREKSKPPVGPKKGKGR